MVEFLKRVLFESLPWLLVFEVIAIGLAVAVHRRRLTPGSRRGVWITLAVCALLLVVQPLVITDYEAIEQLVGDLATAADQGDMKAMDARIDAEFRVGQVDKAQILEIIRQRLQEWQIDEPRINALTIEILEDEADVRFRAFCDLRNRDQAQHSVPSYWRLRCVRRGDQWRMLRIEDAEMGPGVLTRQGGLDLMGYLNLRR